MDFERKESAQDRHFVCNRRQVLSLRKVTDGTIGEKSLRAQQYALIAWWNTWDKPSFAQVSGVCWYFATFTEVSIEHPWSKHHPCSVENTTFSPFQADTIRMGSFTLRMERVRVPRTVEQMRVRSLKTLEVTKDPSGMGNQVVYSSDVRNFRRYFRLLAR